MVENTKGRGENTKTNQLQSVYDILDRTYLFIDNRTVHTADGCLSVVCFGSYTRNKGHDLYNKRDNKLYTYKNT